MHRSVLIFLFAFAFSYSCVAQQYPFVHYTPKDGLVNSRVRKIYQDSRGRMYFLTYSGLSVYDGSRFKNYTVQNGLSIDMVNDVVEAGDDSLLVATNTSHLNALVHGQMKELKFSNGICPTINQFLKSEDGHIYLAADEGLFVIKQNRIERLYFPMPDEQKKGPFLGDITEWKDYLLIATNDLRNYAGLYAFNKKTGQLASLIPDKSIAQLGKDRQGRLWISTSDGFYNIDTASLQKGILKLVAPFSPFQHVATHYGSYFDFSDHSAWYINSPTGVAIAGDDGSVRRFELPKLAADMSLTDIFIDRENITWISTGVGVIKITGTHVTMQQPAFLANADEPINFSLCTGDTTWLGTNDKLIRVTNTGFQKFNWKITYQLMMQNGRHLVASDLKSIYRIHIPSTSDKKIQPEKVYTVEDSNHIWSISTIDANGNFIIASLSGILVLKNNKVIYKYPTSYTEGVHCIRIDDNNRLWLFARQLGIVVFTLHPEDPEHYLQLAFDFRKELGDMSLRSVTMDKNGDIWVGTRYDGVVAFHFTGTSLELLHHIQMQQGLTDNFVQVLGCDSANNIIVGTPTGLDRLHPDGDHYRVENITRSSNIFGYFRNIWVNRKGETFAIMGRNTILQIDAPASSTAKYSPQLFIEEMKVNGQTVSDFGTHHRFTYSQRNLSFNVAAPAFFDEKQVQFSYRLAGTDNSEWSEPSSSGNINLLNLPPGEYTLQLRARFPSTSYSSKEIAYHFTIIPPWWQTWWARLGLVAVVSLVLVVIIGDYYRRKLVRQQAALEKQKAIEKERTRIASDIHDDLGSGLSTIRFLSEKVKRNTFSEVTRDDIDKMQVTSNNLMDKMNEIIWAMNEKNDSLEDLLFYTRSYAMEYCENNRLNCTIFLPEYIPPVTVTGEMRRNIFLTVKESLHNIVKHAHADSVIITMEAADGLEIHIKDNGKGFKNGRKFSGGNGLLNMQQRMESIGGRLCTKNGDGFTVTMSVPLTIKL